MRVKRYSLKSIAFLFCFCSPFTHNNCSKKREGQEEKNNDDIKWAIDEEEDNFDRCVI
jgi:hypothetical protein